MEVSQAAILVRDSNAFWEGLRSALGLTMSGITASIFLVETEPSPDQEHPFEDFIEVMEMLQDMGGAVYATQNPDPGLWEPMQCISLEQIAENLKSCPLIIPFGVNP
ncbi:MAG: hypothetical protein PVG03_01200 [Desulfarculaceae bacterium]|jgi:hypothetical protein